MIPVPRHRGVYAGVGLDKSYLSIEMLFEDQALKEIDCLGEAKQIAGGGEIITIKNKSGLWQRLAGLDCRHFSGFSSLFAKVKQCFESSIAEEMEALKDGV